jgi:hypothetical protein
MLQFLTHARMGILILIHCWLFEIITRNKLYLFVRTYEEVFDVKLKGVNDKTVFFRKQYPLMPKESRFLSGQNYNAATHPCVCDLISVY